MKPALVIRRLPSARSLLAEWLRKTLTIETVVKIGNRRGGRDPLMTRIYANDFLMNICADLRIKFYSSTLDFLQGL